MYLSVTQKIASQLPLMVQASPKFNNFQPLHYVAKYINSLSAQTHDSFSYCRHFCLRKECLHCRCHVAPCAIHRNHRMLGSCWKCPQPSCQTLVLQNPKWFTQQDFFFAFAYWENIRTRCCYATLGAPWAHVCEDDAMTQLFQKNHLETLPAPHPQVGINVRKVIWEEAMWGEIIWSDETVWGEIRWGRTLSKSP